MWNISKMANRRPKWTKIWTWGAIVNIWQVLLIPDSFSLVWGHSVHFAKFPILQFGLKLCSSLNFHPIHPNLIQCIIIIQVVTFSGDCPNFFLDYGI